MAAPEQEASIFQASQASREIQPSQDLGAVGNGYPHAEDSAATVSCESNISQRDEEEEDEEGLKDGLKVRTVPLKTPTSKERFRQFALKVWGVRWSALPYDRLPDWLKDNDFLYNGYRPPLPSFRACFLSIFRLHTETGNIWTHLLGFLFFLFTGIAYIFRPNVRFVDPLKEKLVVGLFFLGVTLCLFFSWLFHTVSCRSQKVALMFSKLDYCGITMQIIGSFVPWIYYWFYCSPTAQFTHLTTIALLGATSIVVSQWECFSSTPYRAVRAGVFLGLALSGLIPFIHFLVISGGIMEAAKPTQLGGLMFVAMLYLIGGAVYAGRIPERFCPGRFDIWFHSHQIFHTLVVVGAMIHLYYISQMQEFHSSTGGACGPDGQRVGADMQNS